MLCVDGSERSFLCLCHIRFYPYVRFELITILCSAESRLLEAPNIRNYCFFMQKAIKLRKLYKK